MDDPKQPAAGQIWRHKRKGTLYFVIGVKNAENPWDDDNNPPHVQYMDGEGGDYSRDIKVWHSGFIFEGWLGQPGLTASNTQ